MSEFLIQQFDNKTTLDKQLAVAVAAQLSAAIVKQGFATLVVSGGSTPLGFFECLSQQAIAWSQVTITLADERWLDASHADSNEKLIRDHLLVNHAAQTKFLPLYNGAADAMQGFDSCNQQLLALHRFDVVILGMGEDGHTASLFPQATALDAGLDMDSGNACVLIDPVTASYQRMSMTLPRLLNSQLIIVHITGARKKAIFDAAWAAKPDRRWPISSVLSQRSTPVQLYWSL